MSWLDLTFLDCPVLIGLVPILHVLTCPDHFRLYLFWLNPTWLDLSWFDLFSNWNRKLAFKPFKHPLYTLKKPSFYCLDTICLSCIHPSETFQTPSRHAPDTFYMPLRASDTLIWFKVLFKNFKLSDVVSGWLGGYHPNNQFTS